LSENFTVSVTEVEGVCMSLPGFLLAAIFLLSVLVGSCLLCTYFWLKLQKRTKSFQAAKTVHLETFPMSKAWWGHAGATRWLCDVTTIL